MNLFFHLVMFLEIFVKCFFYHLATIDDFFFSVNEFHPLSIDRTSKSINILLNKVSLDIKLIVMGGQRNDDKKIQFHGYYDFEHQIFQTVE